MQERTFAIHKIRDTQFTAVTNVIQMQLIELMMPKVQVLLALGFETFLLDLKLVYIPS